MAFMLVSGDLRSASSPLSVGSRCHVTGPGRCTRVTSQCGARRVAAPVTAMTAILLLTAGGPQLSRLQQRRVDGGLTLTLFFSFLPHLPTVKTATGIPTRPPDPCFKFQPEPAQRPLPAWGRELICLCSLSARNNVLRLECGVGRSVAGT